MDSDVIIRVEGLGKRYRLGQGSNGRYTALRDVLAQKATEPLRWLRSARQRDNGTTGHQTQGSVVRGLLSGSPRTDELWALRDVSFEVKRGEVVGIIGRNGAGKSTLLKILSRITEPTEGRVRLKGRVGSLLEVGTGFHPELTGRENIFLNGAILGMTRAEIQRKFDEIVDFAEIEKFLDTPVKRYSSGMYVRLAFAVAAHLDPEILVVDEVLAVGDAEFQKKCVGKMGRIAGQGRTVLFVSHNLLILNQLCERAVWLDRGMINLDGQSGEVIASYLSSSRSAGQAWIRSEPESSDVPVVFNEVRVDSSKGSAILQFEEPITLEIAYTVARPVKNVSMVARVIDANGIIVFTTGDADADESIAAYRDRGEYRARCKIPARILRPGQYDVSVGLHQPGGMDWPWREGVISFEVSPVGCGPHCDRIGVIAPVIEWRIDRA
jgi:lipopolysaccharide transport system ATP-binding protein